MHPFMVCISYPCTFFASLRHLIINSLFLIKLTVNLIISCISNYFYKFSSVKYFLDIKHYVHALTHRVLGGTYIITH